MFDFINKKMSELSITGMVTLGRYEEALKMIEQQLKTDPENSSLFLQKGICLYGMKQYQEARKSLKRSLEINPKLREALVKLGECERTLGNNNEAVANFEKADRIRSLSRKEILGFIKSLVKLGKYQKAMKYLKKSSVFPLDLVDIVDIELQKIKIELFLKLGKPEEALSIIQMLEPLNIQKDVTIDLYKADALLSLDRTDEAGFIIEMLMQKIPGSNYVKSLYSKLLQKQGKYKEALEIIKEALKLNPKEERLHYSNLDLLIKTREYREALITLEGLSNVLPRLMYLNYKSKIFLELDEINKATMYNNKAIEEDPESAKSYIIKAEILFIIYKKDGNKNPTRLYQAIEELSKAITLTAEREKIEQINELKSKIEKELTE